MDRVFRVLIVEDSAFARKVLRELLLRSPYIEVIGSAMNGAEALAAVERLAPDVVTCDLTMPEMDGPTFVRCQMERRPVPIVITSGHDAADELTIAALEAGAISFVQKPTRLATDHLYRIGDELIAAVKLAAQSRPHAVNAARRPAPMQVSGGKSAECVVIGTSTGGPAAIARLLPRLPADLAAPVGLVVHMPAGYTDMFAQRLDKSAAVRVVEARDGDAVEAGVAYVAAGGRHMTFERIGGRVLVRSGTDPASAAFRPSVDVLFKSAAEVWGGRTLGVVMTGMGRDGTAGAAAIKAKGGHIITEAESSCVVYGMPRAVAEAGLSDRSLPLDNLAEAIAMHTRKAAT